MENPSINDASLSPDEAREIYHSQKHPVLVVDKDFYYLTGSLKAAIFLSQCIYWDNIMMKRKNCGTFYKTDKEWMEETALTIEEIYSIRKKLVSLNYISVRREKAGGVTHYVVNLTKIVEDQDNFHAKPDSTKSINKVVEKVLSHRGKPAISGGKIPHDIGENTPCQVGKYPMTSGKIPHDKWENPVSDIIHKNTHKIIHQTADPTPETTGTEATQGMDGFNKIEGVKYKQGYSGLSLPMKGEESDKPCIDGETRQFMAIWPELDKTSHKLVKEALQVALTKKSFKFLCEYANDFVSAQKHNNSSHEFITRPHTWLNKEMWPVKTPQNNVVNRIYRRVTEEIDRSKVLKRKINETLKAKLGKEIYNDKFSWQKVSIVVQPDSTCIRFIFDTLQQKNEAENYYAEVKDTLENIEGLQGREVLFTESLKPYGSSLKENAQVFHNGRQVLAPVVSYQKIGEELGKRREEMAKKGLNPTLNMIAGSG